MSIDDEPGWITPSLADLLQSKLFIDGAWVNAQPERSFDVVDPSDGRVLSRVQDGSVADGLSAVGAAQRAAAEWAGLPPRTRGEILSGAYRRMMARSDDLALLIAAENGKALPDAKAEIAYAAEFFRWFSEEAVRIDGQMSRAPSGSNQILVDYKPIGVAVLVTPWNFPAAMATRKLAPALAAGCTCVLKPAAETPLTALAIAKILRQEGLPDGVFNVVTTSNPGPVVDAMLHDPSVRKLSFTGSTAVGRTLLRAAADQVISCSMELGGNAPFVVFDDADLDEAVAGAMLAKMRNGGQACTAANRFFVQRGIYAAFVGRLSAAMSAVRVGRSADPLTQCGPLVSAAAVAKVNRLLDSAVAEGARVVSRGVAPPEGFFVPPVVLVDVVPQSAILREEIFGPVAVIVAFDDEEQAVEYANATEHGLVSYVYTSDLKRGLRVAGSIESGMVGINRGLVSDAAAPFGGVKQSGLGREGGSHGILEYLEAKYMAVAW